MDRKGQLRNVAFGGAWSEQIAGQEELLRALDCLEAAADRSADEDLSQDAEVAEALSVASMNHPKGADLAASYRKALTAPLAGHRVRELRRIVALFRAAVMGRIS